MMKVFHIICKLDLGGSERVAINIAKHKDNDVEQHIVELMRGNSAFTEGIISELEENGIPYHRSCLPVLFEWHYVMQKIIAMLFPLRFLFLWLKYRPDVIHCHTEMPEMAVWLSLKMMPFINIKVVRTIHNTKLWTGMAHTGARVEKFMQKRNANIAISDNVKKAYTSIYGGNPPIIYNGVAPVEQSIYQGLIEGKTNICFAGRLEEQKGITTLCEIIERLKDDTRYHFHIFGSGRLQYLIDNISHLPNVSVSGPLNGIAEYLGSFDYVIMPSVHEGLSIFALEASFNGAPLLINRCDGLADTLPEDWPLAVNGNNIDQWMEIFQHKISATDRNILKSQALTYVKSRFSIEIMQAEYVKVYRRD